MAHLHLGTFEADALIELLPGERHRTIYRGDDLHPGLDGKGDGKPDSWEEWGETLTKTYEPEHIVIVGDSTDLLADVAWVLSQSPSLLQPMTYPYQKGTLACITPNDDWSEPYYSLEDTQAARFIGNMIHNGVEEGRVWEWTMWRERQGLPEVATGPDHG